MIIESVYHSLCVCVYVLIISFFNKEADSQLDSISSIENIFSVKKYQLNSSKLNSNFVLSLHHTNRILDMATMDINTFLNILYKHITK